MSSRPGILIVAVLALSVAIPVATAATADCLALDKKAQAHLDMGQIHVERARKFGKAGKDKPAEKQLAQAKREFATAEGLWRQALRLDPESVMAHVKLGTALTLGGRYDKAQSVFEQGLRVKPDAPMLLFHLGTLSMHRKRWKRARGYFEKTLRVAAWYPDAHYMLGYLYEREGRYKLAGKEYIAERRNDASNLNATTRLMMLQKQGKFGRNWDVKERWTLGRVAAIAATIAVGLAIFAFAEIRKRAQQQLLIERQELGAPLRTPSTKPTR